MSKKIPLVSIVILNYNGIDYTVNCLESIEKSVFKDYEIIVVDNGSTDNSVEVLSKRKDIRLVQNEKNTGFAEGNNIGTRVARGVYVCLLNNDTLVHKNWLKELVDAAGKDNSIAVCNPKFFDKYGASDYHFHGYGTIGLFHAPVFLPFLDKDSKECIRSLTASGSAFFKKDVIGEPFESDYFAYAEDAQLGWRTNLMGFKVIHVPASIVYHEGAVTAKRMDVPRDFFFVLAERNKLTNIVTMYGAFALIRLLPYFLVNFILANIYDPGHFFSRFKVYSWIISNFGKVMQKRKRMQSLRRVSDKEIVRLMSYKVYDEHYIKSWLLKPFVYVLNRLFFLYCSVVGLRTIEFCRLRSKRGIISPE